MSRVQKTSPKSIQRLTAVNTFIISQNLSSGGNVLTAGDYKITNDIDETKQSMTVTSSNGDHLQNNSLNIIDEKGNNILECNQVQSTCLRNVFNIYSPAGFKLGSFRKRLCKYKPEWELCSGNRNLLFLLKIDSKTSGFKIKITNVNEQRVVATIDLMTIQIDKIEFTLTYLENIAILPKILILCAAISCCEQEYKVQTFKYNICSILHDKLCCPLFDKSKIKFIIVCIFSPALIASYLIGLLLYVFFWTYSCACLICCLLDPIFPTFEHFRNLVLTWPWILCGLETPNNCYK